METRNRIQSELLKRARDLRRNSAPAERKLWFCLRNRQLNGHKFRRQHNVGPFIADFICSEAKLIVELDGPSHDSREAYDQERTAWLLSNGYWVMRVPNEDVHQNLDGVLIEIAREIESESVNEQTPSP